MIIHLADTFAVPRATDDDHPQRLQPRSCQRRHRPLHRDRDGILFVFDGGRVVAPSHISERATVHADDHRQEPPLGPDGENGIAQPTPPELQDRRLETIDRLPPPPDDQFVATIGPVPDDVITRSTSIEECPVTRDELAYINVAHYGFDGELHTGETIVNAAVADDIVGVFEKLHAARFPIERMKVTTQAEVDAAPTGDGNNSGAFGCRPAVGSSGWSMHAYGLAVDINPFHNPYEHGELIIPELAMSYLDRDRVLPGMVFDGDVVVEAFAEIGWS